MCGPEQDSALPCPDPHAGATPRPTSLEGLLRHIVDRTRGGGGEPETDMVMPGVGDRPDVCPRIGHPSWFSLLGCKRGRIQSRVQGDSHRWQGRPYLLSLIRFEHAQMNVYIRPDTSF